MKIKDVIAIISLTFILFYLFYTIFVEIESWPEDWPNQNGPKCSSTMDELDLYIERHYSHLTLQESINYLPGGGK